jgi:hypothetical protein
MKESQLKKLQFELMEVGDACINLATKNEGKGSVFYHADDSNIKYAEMAKKRDNILREIRVLDHRLRSPKSTSMYG